MLMKSKRYTRLVSKARYRTYISCKDTGRATHPGTGGSSYKWCGQTIDGGKTKKLQDIC